MTGLQLDLISCSYGRGFNVVAGTEFHIFGCTDFITLDVVTSCQKSTAAV